ncbi:AAA family ATPase [Psychrosphaera haliotis]|uniref:ORC1/DEAH AAA+ ATPase domain-containing protein n=1 Tax=Psychrosphaera haliotis TaxID=555083 RepID=A0A6N8FEN5_9GAMM|nr:AAA family ATPase [Psychrosphaera haliotis]MUH73132.1 hypothetical protein [Psychrosphaera haliotis]
MTNTQITNGFYIPPSRQRFLNTVQELLSRTGIVAMEGTVGIGKTSMLEELLTSALPNANKCYLTAVSSINDIQVRSRIIEQLFGNVLFDPEKPMLNAFLEFGGNTELMIAIDNGHHLSGQIIGEILQVVAEFKKQSRVISILFTFDKQISNTIGSITSALISVMPIPKFSEKESYILIKQSFDDVPSPDTAKVKRWIENAQGNPIQLLAFDTQDALKLAKPVAMNIKLWVSNLVVASLLLALGVYMYRLYFTEEQSLPKTIKEKTIKPTVEPMVSDWSSAKVKEHVVKVKQTQMPEDNTASSSDILEALNNAMEPQKEVEAVTANIEAVTANIEPAAETLESVPNVNKQSLPAEIAKEAISEPVVNLPEGPPSEKEISLAPSEAKFGLESESELNLPSSIAPLTVAGYRVNNQQMLSLPSNKFVLQLTAVSQESTLETYLIEKRLDAKLTRIYKISRNNSDWLVVTYGLFDTIASARETAKNIDQNAWAKSTEAIQQQIKSYNESLSQ